MKAGGPQPSPWVTIPSSYRLTWKAAYDHADHQGRTLPFKPSIKLSVYCCRWLTLGWKASATSYLGPLAFLGEQVSIMVGFPPVLFEGMGPHELPVAQVVDLPPLLLGRDAGQVLLPGLQVEANESPLLNRFQTGRRNRN